MNYIDPIERMRAVLDSISDDLPPELTLDGAWRTTKILRPCIAAMKAVTQVGEGTRNERLYRIACELYRLGYDRAAVEKECLRVNDLSFKAALGRHEVRATVKSAEGNQKVHQCYDSLLKSYCVGMTCPIVRSALTGVQVVTNDLDVFEEQWACLLPPQVAILYRFLLDEQKRSPTCGGLTLSSRKIAQILSWPDKGRVLTGLRRLAEVGLIDVVSSGIGGKQATGLAQRIRCVSPVPPPTLKHAEGR